MQDLSGCCRQRLILPRSLTVHPLRELFQKSCPMSLSWETERQHFQQKWIHFCEASWQPHNEKQKKKEVTVGDRRKQPSSPGFRIRAGPVFKVHSITLFITAYSRQAESRQGQSVFIHTNRYRKNTQAEKHGHVRNMQSGKREKREKRNAKKTRWQ